MNTQITSAEEILKAAQKILLEHGASALNMRAVAAACGVSVGSIYNYFPSKSALIGATIESVWTEIFRPFTSRCYTSFDDAATALLAALADGEGRYPGFFSLHALSFASGDKAEGRARMADRKLVGTAVVACLSLEDRLARSVEPVAGARSLGRYRQ